jgi:Dyp-type peroxidase family
MQATRTTDLDHYNAANATSMRPLTLDLEKIQGDVLIGMQKNAENFIFFKIVDVTSFKSLVKGVVLRRIANSSQVQQQELSVQRHKSSGRRTGESFRGVNLGFTQHGLTQLIGAKRPKLDPAFEKGADHSDTISALRDPSKADWLQKFNSDRVDGILLVTGANALSVTFQSNELLRVLAGSIKVVYSEIGQTRPGTQRGHEHFGFLDGISQPGIRGLTTVGEAWRSPDQQLPGQDLIWPGEFVFGYPGQHPEDPHKEGPPPEMAAPWLRNGSYMVFRRLEQKVPEFWRFVRDQAVRLGMDSELLGARMVGRWKSGAPLELAPMRDDLRLGADERRRNDFEFSDDPDQRRCPYAAHIRKVYPRDDTGNEAEVQRHRIIRQGIAFGPEVAPGETTTRHSRGLMFVCYQTSIERQFEFIQRRHSNDPGFVDGKVRPASRVPVRPGYDPIIGRAPDNGPRAMDEPYSNYPGGNRRTTLEIPSQFVVLTAAGYFFMPSLSALRTVLT